MRVGDIVRTPDIGVYGGMLAIVVSLAPGVATVQTKNATLVYERRDLSMIARIVIGRAYGSPSRRRFRACEIEFMDGTRRRVDALVRDTADLGEITTALEIRKRAFSRLLEVLDERATDSV